VRIDKLHKLRLGGAASVELHAVEPKLGVVEQVECCERHATLLSSGVHRIWKNRSQRFNHGNGSPIPSNLGNSNLCAMGTGSAAGSPASASPGTRRTWGGGREAPGAL
jgi:hypothetical protein